MKINELDTMDRATLRAWRIANLVGWWFVGTLVFDGLLILVGRTIVAKVNDALGSRALLVALGIVVFAAATSGAIVGSRVFRLPGTVAALTVLVPWLPFVLVRRVGWNVGEALLPLLILAIPAGIAFLVARRVFARRPRALRSGGPGVVAMA